MAHSNSQTFPEGEPKGGKRQTKVSEEKSDGLNSAIEAVEGGQRDSGTDPETPEIQPAGDFPSIKEAYADMSQPPPAPPAEHFILDHSSTPPTAAFRVQPRIGAGIHLWMFSLPFGTAKRGEAFVHPIVAALREQLMKECPALVPKRFEIRLILDASGKNSLLEVPADPALTVRGEDNRLSLLRLIEHAEREAVIGEKIVGGKWIGTPSAQTLPAVGLAQSLGKLIDLTYGEALIRNIEHPLLQRYRKKIG